MNLIPALNLLARKKLHLAVALAVGTLGAALPVVSSATDASTASKALPGYEIIRLGRGHYNRLLIAATIAGKKGLMMLDTGADVSVLNSTTYHSLETGAGGTLPAGSPKTIHINGTQSRLVATPDFYVGTVNLGAVPVAMLPQHNLNDETVFDGSSGGRTFDGILGENLLRHYNAVVDCGRLVLYLNTNPAKKLGLSAAFINNGWTRIAMSALQNDFTVPCLLNGHHFRLIVDTGAPFTTLDRRLVGTADVSTRDTGLRGGLITVIAQPEVGVINLNTLQIGSYVATNLHMTSTPLPLDRISGDLKPVPEEGPIAGLLGGDALANNGAVIDIGNSALYLKHVDAGAATKKR